MQPSGTEARAGTDMPNHTHHFLATLADEEIAEARRAAGHLRMASTADSASRETQWAAGERGLLLCFIVLVMVCVVSALSGCLASAQEAQRPPNYPGCRHWPGPARDGGR